MDEPVSKRAAARRRKKERDALKLEGEGRHEEPTSDAAAAALPKEAEADAAPKLEDDGCHGEPTSHGAAAALSKEAEAALKLEREDLHGDPTSDGTAAATAATTDKPRSKRAETRRRKKDREAKLKLQGEGRHGDPTSGGAAAALPKEAELDAAPKIEREGRRGEPKTSDDAAVATAATKDKPASRRASAALRKEVEAALKLEREGRNVEAIARVDGLAAKHGESPLVLHLAGHIHHAAATRAVEGKALAHHIITAHGHLAKAKRLVPNCIAISSLMAIVLLHGGKADEAEREARESVNIAFPVDPADNSALYARSSSTKDQRVDHCRKSARASLSVIESYIPRTVREVLDAAAVSHDDGGREALNKAEGLAKRCPSSSRAQLLWRHMLLHCVRLFGPDMDKRRILGPAREALEEAIANRFGDSLVLALFHAKLCFVLGLYEKVYFEFVRAFAIPEPLDPKLEDIPPYSVQGDEYDDRVLSVLEEFLCLHDRLSSVAKDFQCSMTSEKQDSFLSVPLIDLQEYYHKNFGNYQWAATPIPDALIFFKKNLSWRFWICPFCASNEPENSLLDHMNSKHLPKLQSVLSSLQCQNVIIADDHLDQIKVYQDSEGHHLFRFNKTDYVFRFMPILNKEWSFVDLQEMQRKQGKEILEKIKDKLKPLPAEEFNTEFDEALSEIRGLWLDFVSKCMLDYRRVIMTFAKPFIWTKLLQSLSKDKASSKIDNDDIDVIFPRGEVRAEDKVRRLEIQPNSSITDAQSGETGLKYRPSIANKNSASNLLGSSSQSSDDTTIISIYRKSIEVLDKDTDTDAVFILNLIIQMLWNLRCFRDEFLKRRPVCTLPCHGGPCIGQMLYDIFSAWEKDDHHITDSLISVRDTICQVLNDRTVIENVDVNTSSYIVANILKGLKMPGVLQILHDVNIPYDKKVLETLTQAIDAEKVMCNKEIICGGVGIKESTTCGDKLDADSLQITEVKSFAADNQLSVSIPEFSTIAVHIVPSEGRNQRTLREVMPSDPDFVLCRFRHTTPDKVKCTFISIIFYHEGKLLSIFRGQNKWLVFLYNDAVANEFNSLKDLLHHYGDHEIHSGVYFLDNIKILD